MPKSVHASRASSRVEHKLDASSTSHNESKLVKAVCKTPRTPSNKINKLDKLTKPQPKTPKTPKKDRYVASVLLVDPAKSEVLLLKHPEKGCWSDIGGKSTRRSTDSWNEACLHFEKELGFCPPSECMLGSLQLESKSKCKVHVCSIEPMGKQLTDALDKATIRRVPVQEFHRLPRDELHPRLQYCLREEMFKLMQIARCPLVLPEDLLMPESLEPQDIEMVVNG